VYLNKARYSLRLPLSLSLSLSHNDNSVEKNFRTEDEQLAWLSNWCNQSTGDDVTTMTSFNVGVEEAHKFSRDDFDAGI